MERYKVIIAYDGTQYMGFQRQPRRTHNQTIQGFVEAALKKLDWRGERILAAGRTDTGVHSFGQVIAFDLEWHHTTDELCAALNALLPGDISALHAESVMADFHPRYDAIARCYRYRIYSNSVRNPLLERYAWRVWPDVDVPRLQQAGNCIVGTHDFAAFGKPQKKGSSTVRTIFSACWQPAMLEGLQPGWDFIIKANSFLYRMVRRLVFFQVAIGQHKVQQDLLPALLKSPPANVTQGLAPPRGLVLMDITYPF